MVSYIILYFAMLKYNLRHWIAEQTYFIFQKNKKQVNGMTPIFIAIEGPIGVGKSSLARAISERYGFHLLKEIVSENPFLDSFYKNINKWAFQTEMFFLVNRFNQMEEIDNHYLQNNISVVSDYHMFKNLLFANRTLDQYHFNKYKQIFHILTEDLPEPNLIIYLYANVNTLLRRIEKRGREFEKNISPEYLENLCKDYERYIAKIEQERPELAIIKINGDELDFVENQDHLQHIFNELEKEITKGVIEQ